MNKIWFNFILFFALISIAVATGEPYIPNTEEDYLISHFDYSFKDQRDNNFKLSYKCLSYAASGINDWNSIQSGKPLYGYNSFLNDEIEEGINPRMLENIYYKNRNDDLVNKYEESFKYHVFQKDEILNFEYSKQGWLQSIIKLFKDLTERDPVTLEQIPINLRGYSEILTSSESNIIYESITKDPMASLFEDELLKGYKYELIPVEFSYVMNAINKWGILYSMTEAESDILKIDFPIHSMTIVGYHDGFLWDNYLIAHDNYGVDGSGEFSMFKKLYIDKIAELIAFYDPQWSMYQHDLRRTGLTTLKGSLDSDDKRKYEYEFDPGFSDTPGVFFRDKPSVGDINRDGLMDLVMTSSKMGLETESKVFAVSCGDTCKKKNVEFDYSWDESYKGDYYIYSNPVIVDLDGYSKEVIVATTREIVAIDGLNGEELGKFEVTTKPNNDKFPINGEVNHLAVADVDYDGEKEIIFAPEYSDENIDSDLYILNSDLTVDSIQGLVNNGPRGALAIANIIQSEDSCNGVDYPEIVMGASDGLYIFRYNSCLGKVTQYKKTFLNGIFTTPVIADIDMDNEYEIIVATGNWTKCYGTCENKLRVFDNTGDLKASIDADGDYFISDIAVGRIDSDDGDMEIVISTRESTDFYNNQYYTPIHSYGDIRVYSYSGSSLINIANFDDSGSLDTNMYPSAIADIDGSGRQDIIFGDYNKNLYAIELQGSSWKKVIEENLGQVVGTPAVGDWDNDGSAEIAIRNKKVQTQSIQEFQSQAMTIQNFLIENFGTVDDFTFQRFMMMAGDAELTLISQNNSQPELTVVDEILAMEGDLIVINASATDADNDTLEFYYSYPFDENGTWQSQINDSGEYEILVSVTDGNLTDSKYINLILLRNDSLKQNISNKTFQSNTTIDDSMNFNIENETRIWLADFQVKGEQYETTQTNFTYGQASVIEYNGWDESNATYQISNAIDQNDNTYYSAGEATGLIVEISNLAIPNQTDHIIVKLKLRISDGGAGRFGIYNYNENITEIITSSIPITEDGWIYFDIYQSSTPLWSTNQTHYSYKVNNINDFISTDKVRWYYRYKYDSFADQRVYESMVSFKEEETYPKDIILKLNNQTVFKSDELFEDTAKTTSFNDSSSNQTITLTSNSLTKYIEIPKDATVTKATLSMGNQSTNDINATSIEVVEEQYDLLGHICKDEDTILNCDNVPGCGAYITRETVSGTYCANAWKISDVDNDSDIDKYWLINQTLTQYAGCLVYYQNDVHHFTFDGTYKTCYGYGSWTYGCDDENEVSRIQWSKTTPQSSITSKTIYCYYGSSSYNEQYIQWGETLKDDENDNYQILECFTNQDCDVNFADGEYYCDVDYNTPTNNECKHPTCSRTCENFEHEAYSNYTTCECDLNTGRCDTINHGWENVADNQYCNMTSHYPTSQITINCSDHEVAYIENHIQKCGLGPGRCEDINTQINESHYCDSQHFIQKISTYVKVNDSKVALNRFQERLEVDIANNLNNELEKCIPNEEGMCLIPIIFESDYNMTTSINYLDVNYQTNRIEIKDIIQNNLLNNIENFTVEVQSGKGKVSLEDFRIYSSPNTPPKVLNDSITITEGEEIIIELYDQQRDTLTTEYSDRTFSQVNNQLIKPIDYNDAGTSELTINVSDGLYTAYKNVSVTVLNDYTKDVLITEFDYMATQDLNDIFFIFRVENNNPESKNVTYQLDTGETNFTYTYEISPNQDLKAIINYTYSSTGDFEVTLSNTNQNSSDQKTIYLSTKKIVSKDFMTYVSKGPERIYSFTIENQGTSSEENISWSFNSGIDSFNSTQDIILNSEEEIFVFVKETYELPGDYQITAESVYQGISDKMYADISIIQAYLENYQLYSLNNNSAIFGFSIENNWNNNLEAVNWQHESGESNTTSDNFSLSEDESIFVFVSHDYTSSGNHTTSAIADYNNYKHIKEMIIEVE